MSDEKCSMCLGTGRFIDGLSEGMSCSSCGGTGIERRMTSPDTGRAGEVRVELPWPDKILSPNARIHWRRKAAATKKARYAAWALTLEATGPNSPSPKSVVISMTFCPPDNRRRDRDNLIASMKAATDGISDALLVDDSKFQTTYSMAEPVKGGAVIVTIRGIE